MRQLDADERHWSALNVLLSWPFQWLRTLEPGEDWACSSGSASLPCWASGAPP